MNTAQKIKFSIKDFFSKCDQIHMNLLIWSHLLKKSFMENIIFGAVEALRKLHISTKFLHQEMRWNYGILCSEYYRIGI